MEWYIVVKTINGHRYQYRQKTWREGHHVRTRSEYIGPADDGAVYAPRAPSSPRAPRAPAPTPEKLTAVIERSLNSLMGRCSKEWGHAWEAQRDGPILVKKKTHIESVLRALEVHWSHETSGAYFSPRRDTVNIPPMRCFEDSKKQSATQAYYIVLFHELVHWTGGDGRIDRQQTGYFGSTRYAREELVAELGATALMKHFGVAIGDAGRHANYFQHWLERAGDREEALKHAAREADRAVRYIIEHGTVAV